MTRYLLDTNIVSFYVKDAFPALTRRMQSVPGRQLFLSSVIEAELRVGLAFLPAHARARVATEELLRSIIVEPWDSRCAHQYAALAVAQKRTGKSLAALDSLIAAHAFALDVILVTNDAAFAHVENLRVEDWTKGPQPA